MENKNKRNNRNIILGTIIALVGGLLLISNFGLIGFPVTYYLFSWKTLLIVIGISMMTFRKHLTGGIFLTGLGVIFWLPALFNYQFALNQVFLPALLVVIGVILLLKASGLYKPVARHNKYTHYEEVESTVITNQDSK